MRKLGGSTTCCLLAAGVLCGAATHDLTGQDGTTIVLIDHATREVRIGERAVYAHDPILVPTGPLAVHVVNTNTALFEYRITADTLTSPASAALNTFGMGAGDYLLELFPLDLREARSDTADCTGLHHAFNEVATTRVSLAASALVLQQAVQSVRSGQSTPSAASEWSRTQLEGQLTSRPSRTNGGERIEGLLQVDALLTLMATLGETLASGPWSGCPGLEAARSLVGSSPAILTSAYELERVMREILGGRSVWKSQDETPPVRIPPIGPLRGVILTLDVKRDRNELLNAAADLDEFKLSLRLFADLRLRPVAGLSVIYVPAGEVSRYVGATASARTRVSRRMQMGLTLGLAIRELDRRTQAGWAIILPELLVNPADDGRSLAVGGSVLFRDVVKLGAGVVWVKSDVVREGAIRAQFGPGLLYTGLSIAGWQPFVPG